MTRNKILAWAAALCLMWNAGYAAGTTVPLNAAPATKIFRLMGGDRYLTAVEISKQGWPLGAETVVLTTGADFPDALSAAPLARKVNAPILLVQADRAGSATLDEVKRLAAKKAYIIGGTGVISELIVKQLASIGISSVRLAGENRFDTSLAVAQEVGLSKGLFITGGADYHDALSVASIAAAKGMPILLAPERDLTPAQQEFVAKGNIPATYIIEDDGWNAVPEAVVDRFPDCEIISEATSYERNISVLERFREDLDYSTLYVATGRDFPDALAAAALAAQGPYGIILLEDAAWPDVSSFIANKAAGTFYILGGYGAVEASMEERIRAGVYDIAAIDDIYQSIRQKDKYALPPTVVAMLTNGVMADVRVQWDLIAVDTSRLGTSYYAGHVQGYSKTIQLALTIVPTDTYTIQAITAETVLGKAYDFPKTVHVIKSDGSTQDLPVTWSSASVTTIPSKTGSFTYQGTVAGISQKVKLTLKVSSDVKITFKDPLLDGLIHSYLAKDWGDALYKSDVLEIESLTARSEPLTNISGLENLTNLKFLDLRYNKLSTISSLTKLTNLQTLLLDGNELTAVSSLKSLTNLEVLSLKDNKIKDFKPLKDLTRLKQLYLEDNATKDYAPLAPIYKNLIAKDFDM
ncbi:MAG: cell wall-binding repeat-containing protein [Peptococcaceae bacterium]|jgi:putative cell wall-binding protein|nr:cell wall-binding repeat-containing protein [Peptococcaceae bacterium]